MVLLRASASETPALQTIMAVAFAHGCTAIHQSIVLGDVGVGMNGDRRNFKVLIHGSMVECFDVLEFVNKIVPGRWESVGGHGVEHERIIRVGL